MHTGSRHVRRQYCSSFHNLRSICVNCLQQVVSHRNKRRSGMRTVLSNNDYVSRRRNAYTPPSDRQSSMKKLSNRSTSRFQPPPITAGKSDSQTCHFREIILQHTKIKQLFFSKQNVKKNVACQPPKRLVTRDAAAAPSVANLWIVLVK